MPKPGRLLSNLQYLHGVYVLTSICGMIDVVCFLALGGVFAEMMTGNLLMMAIVIGQHNAIAEVDKFVFALLAFALGALIGGHIMKRYGHQTHPRFAFWLIWMLLGSACLMAMLLPESISHDQSQLLLVILAITMGVQNAVIRVHGEPDVATNLMTVTYTALIAESRLTGNESERFMRRFASVAIFVVSAALGVYLLSFSIAVPLLWCFIAMTLALPMLLSRRHSTAS
jgi:uncharacterized membrane protein YoaK (UPF0700 family)